MDSRVSLSNDVREDVSWLNDQFVKEVLRRKSPDSEVAVRHIGIEMAIPPGENYFGLIYRVHVEFSQAVGPIEILSFIVKTLPKDRLVQKMVVECGFFAREVSAYSLLLPALHCLLDELSLGCCSKLAAKGLNWSVLPMHWLAIEDLTSLGFVMAGRQQGLDLAHCRLVVEALGRLHGASAVLAVRQPDVVAPFLDNPYSAVSSGAEIPRMLYNTVSALAVEVEGWAGYEVCGHKLRCLAGKFFSKVVNIMSRDEFFSVVNHADLWVNNVMFAYSGDLPNAVRFIDFQMPYVTSPTIDLLYFLYTSPMPVVRANHKDELMNWYHASLVDTLCQLGHPETCPSLEELWDDMHRREFYGLFAACCILPFVLSKPCQSLAVQDVIVETPTINTHTFYSCEYITEIKKMLLDFCTRGLLD